MARAVERIRIVDVPPRTGARPPGRPAGDRGATASPTLAPFHPIAEIL